VGAAATFALLRERRTFHVRWEGRILTWDQEKSPAPEGRLRLYFIHEDGGIRVPVLVEKKAIIRGFDEETYRRVLGLKIRHGACEIQRERKVPTPARTSVRLRSP